jgi:hypothetical protein
VHYFDSIVEWIIAMDISNASSIGTKLFCYGFVFWCGVRKLPLKNQTIFFKACHGISTEIQ